MRHGMRHAANKSPPTGRSGCGSNMGQISVKTYATNGSLLNDNQQLLIYDTFYN